jgi:hypothetical protein
MSSDTKKQVPLRLSQGLYAELVRLAEAEFRSVNGQIEYILTQAVRQRRGDAQDGAWPGAAADVEVGDEKTGRRSRSVGPAKPAGFAQSQS